VYQWKQLSISIQRETSIAISTTKQNKN